MKEVRSDSGMIRGALQGCKRLLLVAVLIFSGLGSTDLMPQSTGWASCEAQLEALHQAYYVLYDSGRDDWTDLEPLVNRLHQCFGSARTASHAAVFNYETSILVRQRRFAEAEQQFEHFFAAYADVAEAEVLSKMYMRRGYVYERLGWTAEMLASYASAAALADQVSATQAASALGDAGEYFRFVNDLGTAYRYLASAESLLIPLYAEDPVTHGPTLGVVRMRLARTQLDEAESGELLRRDVAVTAASLLESALDLIPAVPAEAYKRAYALLSLADVYWMRGEPAGAFAPIAEARSLSPWFRTTYPQFEALLWRKAGYTHYLLHQFAEAREAYTTALVVARRAGEQPETIEALIGLGEVEEASADVPDRFQKAEAYFRQAVSLAEEVRRTYGTHDWSASAWEHTQEPYLHLTRVLLRQNRPIEAFLVLDATRARHLRDLQTATRLRATLNLADAARLTNLADRLKEVRRTLGGRGLSIIELTELEREELTLQQQIDATVGWAEANAESDALTLEAVQQALRHRNEVLLTYFLDDDLPTAFVIRADTFAAVPLHTRNEVLQTQVREIGGLWASDGTPEVGIRLTPFHTLYKAIYDPVASLVPDGAPLIVIPDGPLTQLPFALLIEEAHGDYDYADAPYLLRRHPITTELAAMLLVVAAAEASPGLELLALGRSHFEDLQISTLPALPVMENRADASQVFSNLPNVQAELKQLQRHFPNGRVALNENATEALLDQHLSDARILHLASHTLVNPQLPLYSRVLLWDDPDAKDDGTLYLYELQDRALNTDLVTLSGCSTARGRRRVGEGMMGLQYAFRAAGARATLATFWQVDDAAMVELMDSFYGNLRLGIPKDEALRQAQLDYLGHHEGLRASPFFWAAPVLSGSNAPISITASSPPLSRWLLLGLALMLAGLVLFSLISQWKAKPGRR